MNSDHSLLISNLKQRLCAIHERYLCDQCGDVHSRAQEQERLLTSLKELTAYQPQEIERLIQDDPEIAALGSRLRPLCCAAEYELELYWAKRVATDAEPQKTLRQFSFYPHYEQLLRFNMQAMPLAGSRDLKRILFIGCGPLPLSALLLAQTLGCEVDGLDISGEACTAARAFLTAMRSPVKIIESDILNFTDLGTYDAVFLANLVGSDREQKKMVVSHLHRHMRPGALLLARTAHHLRTLYYSHLQPEDLLGFTVHAAVHPLQSVVNSVLVAER